MIEQTTDTLAVVALAQRGALIERGRDRAEHDRILTTLAAFNAIETGGAADRTGPLAFPLKVAAWNLERCLFVEASARHLKTLDPALILLSEMDDGMARTGQRHTTRDIAGELGMAYAYGLEFLELGLGSDTERDFCTDGENRKGFHGNALLSRHPLSRPFLVRLEGERIWRNDPDQPRIGERIAVGAVIETTSGPFVAVSTHLESATAAAYRERQTVDLIDRLDAAFPGLPILIGGDLNTGNHAGGDFEAEGLFARARERGFERHGGPLEAMTTRPSLITRWPERAMKLDWFLSRGLRMVDCAILPSVDAEGRTLSDHDVIHARIEGFI